MPNAKGYIEDLAAKGLHHLTVADFSAALGLSHTAAKLALLRLAKKGDVASPARGFYMIVPPEYRLLGSLPADQFVPALMDRLGLVYYAGLLSAAQYHGAAHHRPQEFQVLVAKNRRSIHCGSVRIAFVGRRRIAEVPVQNFNTPRGTIRVSTVEATVLDLVGYEHHIGGLDQVATIFAELSGQIDPDRLVTAARTAPVSWAQRTGYLLERVGVAKRLGPLKAYVGEIAKNAVPLVPGAPHDHAPRDGTWRVLINADVEAEA